jgi:hypothetical protein
MLLGLAVYIMTLEDKNISGVEQYKNQQDLLDVCSTYRMQPRAIMRLGRLPSLFHKHYAIRTLGFARGQSAQF